MELKFKLSIYNKNYNRLKTKNIVHFNELNNVLPIRYAVQRTL